MNVAIVLFTILVIITDCSDNKLLKNSIIKFQLSRHYKRNIIQTVINNQQDKLPETMNNNDNVILQRFSRCEPPCQPRECCKKTSCVCVHDYWGPVCYCSK